MGFYASLPLLAGTVGDLAGGWISDAWFKRTENVVMARRVIGMGGFLVAGVRHHSRYLDRRTRSPAFCTRVWRYSGWS